jgi:subtilase-type serine protease
LPAGQVPAADRLMAAVLDSSVAGAQRGFTSLAGEGYASLAAAAMNDASFLRSAMLRRMPNATVASVSSFGKAAELRSSTGVASWGETIADSGNFAGTANAAQTLTRSSGLVTGFDKSWNDRFNLGIAFAQVDSEVNTRLPGSANNGMRSWHIGGYVGGDTGPVQLRAGAAMGWYAMRANRFAAFNALTNSLQSRYKAHAFQAFGEASHGFDLGGLALEPYASLTHVAYRTDAFAETAAINAQRDATLALAGRVGNRSTTTMLGLRSAAALGTGGARVRVDLGWKHGLGNSAALADLRLLAIGQGMAITGAQFGRDAAQLDLGVDLPVAANAAFGFSYGGQYSTLYSAQTARAAFRWAF